MVVRYCPRCFAENGQSAAHCQKCGGPLAGEDSESFFAKLLWALDHPEPLTVRRAAWLLGELQDRRAVPSLIKLVGERKDPYILESVVEALGKLKDPRAVPAIEELIGTSYLAVRARAAEALGRIGGEEALAALRQMEDDRSFRVRQAVTDALASRQALGEGDGGEAT